MQYASYDLFESQISDAFVRARTRGRESHMVFMAERGNDVHRRILADCTQLSVEMQEWIERQFHDQGYSVPPQSLHETTNPYH
jgi:endoribonuclease Dicer